MVIETRTEPYLSENYAPIREEKTFDDLRVIGELPREMDGMYVRTGPNPQFDPVGAYHWFDGDGMLHGVRVKDGKASYRNRYVQTAGYKAEKKAGHAVWAGLMEMQRNFAIPEDERGDVGISKNAGNTALVWHDGQLLTLWEGGEPHAIKVPGLETAGPYNYCGKLVSAFTAHPKVDDITGEMMFFGYNPMSAPHLQYSVVSRDGELQFTRDIDIPRGVMMHDFAVTEHYSIFMDLPLTFSIERAMKGGPVLAFEADLPARYGIMPRHGTNADIKWFELPSHYVFHTANAHEDGDEVVLTACRLRTTNVLQPAELPQNRNGDIDGGAADQALTHRWRFNLATGVINEEQLDDISSDFPRVNDSLVGRSTRYSYSARFAKRDENGIPPAFEGVHKYDHQKGTIERHLHGPKRYGGEAVFVPRNGGQDEDDGWLVTYVYDSNDGSSEMVVIDAKDIAAAPIARVLVPSRIPYGFHGAWISNERIESQKAHV
jgi:carotenoid cleavage dioxygenase